MGFIRDATGNFSLALVPLVALAATGAWALVWIGRDFRRAPDSHTMLAARDA
jgi:hypothetical protein